MHCIGVFLVKFLEATGDVGWGSEDFSLSKCVLETHYLVSLNEFTVKLKANKFYTFLLLNEEYLKAGLNIRKN